MFAGRQRPKKVALTQGNNASTSINPQSESNQSARNATIQPVQDDDDQSSNTMPIEVTNVMSIVRLSWDFMTSVEFNPIPYSLSLLDGSSLGSDFKTFCGVHEQVEKGMDSVVNGNSSISPPATNNDEDYHQAFNTAIQKFSSVVDTIADSQKRVRDIKDRLEQSKEMLECKRFDFLHIWVKSLQYKEMGRILEMIVDMQSTQEKLDSLVAERHYLHAVRVLVAAEKTINSPDLVEVQALSAIREGFAKIKLGLLDTLTQELQNHIYLKTRSAMNRIGKEVPSITFLKTDMTAGSPTSDMLRFHKTTPLHEEDSAEQGALQVDSFSHIQLVIEALFHLGKLQDALSYLKERIGIDLFNVVDRVIAEIDKLYPPDADAQADTNEIIAEHHIFHLFLSKLYEKFGAVLDGHIHCLNVASKLLNVHSNPNTVYKSSENFRSLNLSTVSEDGLGPARDAFEMYTKREVATAIQNEIKTLLYDYLTVNDGGAINSGLPVLAITEMLKDARKGIKRPMKQIYHLKSGADENVKRIFEKACPIGTSDTDGNITQQPTDHEFISNSGRFSNIIESGHREIISSNPCNILVAYKPTLDFVTGMEAKIGMRLANFKMFLEDFIFNVYLPEIQEQVLVYFHANVNGIDAFQAERYPDAPFPLIKSACCIILEMHGICRTIKCVPVHSNELVKFVEFTLKKFYEKCSARFRNILADDATQAEEEGQEEGGVYSAILAVQWALDPELTALFAKNSYLGSRQIDLPSIQELNRRETSLELKKKGERSFHRSELLLDPRKIQNLANLIYGMGWVLDQIKHLRNIEPSDSSNSYVTASSKEQMKNFSNVSQESLIDIKFDAEGNIDLPLNKEMEQSFGLIGRSFQHMIQHILYAIRIEIRCHTIFYLDLAIREGNYCSDEDHSEPDPYIGLLNLDLTMMEEMISEALPPRQARFLFVGITELMSTVLISNVKTIRQVNEHGVNRLLSNVQALQQNLISFTALYENDLEKAKLYFSLLGMSSTEITQFLEKNAGMFTFEEYKVVLDLIFADGSNRDKEEGKVLYQKLKQYFVNHRQ